MKKSAFKETGIGHVTTCQICQNNDLKKVISLGHQPIVQEYLTNNTLHTQEVTYPLNLVYCASCGLMQLDHIVSPDIVFPPEYPYRTGLTNMLIRNFRELAESLSATDQFTAGDLIVDIGSNDGSLLQCFKDKGMKVLGVEPTDAADVANKNGIPTIKEFFNQKVVSTIVRKHGQAKVITATNVFAHISNAQALAENVTKLLAADGVFVSESQYLMDIFEKFEFDTIYHEHLRFYALKPLQFLLEHAGMSVVDAERISAAGGSIRVYAMKGKHQMSERAKKLLAAEKKAGLYNTKRHKKFAQDVVTAKHDLISLLLSLKKKGATIAGLGSPARANTLLGFAKITPDIVEYTCEKKGSPKIGMFTPGTHIPVLDESMITKKNPDYVLVLSWHIGLELIKITKKFGYKGKFIMPLPKPRIIK